MKADIPASKARINPNVDESPPLDRLACAALAALVLFTLFVVYAEPVKDGDLWFHLAYARYMVENHTLIPDHTIFSWTPTVGDEIYCCWLPEIILYTLYQKFGLASLIAMRYLFVLVFVGAAALLAAKNRVLRHPLTWLVCLSGVLMAPAGIHIKPEIFSYVLMTCAVCVWLAVRRAGAQRRWLPYLFPVILLIWMNTHGGVVFGMTFLGALFLGEVLNGVLPWGERLPMHIRRHFFAALVLCAPVTLLTPYGWRYPLQLVQNLVLNPQARLEDFSSVTAYLSIFDTLSSLHHFVDFFVLACIVLAVLLWPSIRKRRIDFTVILANLVSGILYVWFVRTTYFWAIVFPLTAIHLLPNLAETFRSRTRAADRAFRVLAVLAVLFLSGRALYDAVSKPLFGFSSSYVSPYQEAEFIRDHYAGLRMGNDYESGSYLLWALWPQTKVFIDARYFPYRPWYGEYVDFLFGRNVEAFLRKYPCDIWCLSYQFPGLAYFAKSPEWTLAHYGPAACIFVRNGIPIPEGKGRGDISWEDLTPHQALKVLRFSLSIGDMDTAKKIAASMKVSRLRPPSRPLAWQAHAELGAALQERGMIGEAAAEFSRAIAIDSTRPEPYTRLGHIHRDRGDLDRSEISYLKALEKNPAFVPALQNLAVVYALKEQYGESLKYFNRILEIQPDNPDVYYNMSCMHARLGDVEQSVKLLEAAVEKGFRDWELLKSDPDLENIRDTPYYRELLISR
jgi:tetratricopeptide (TPR) repeat protein